MNIHPGNRKCEYNIVSQRGGSGKYSSDICQIADDSLVPFCKIPEGISFPLEIDGQIIVACPIALFHLGKLDYTKALDLLSKIPRKPIPNPYRIF